MDRTPSKEGRNWGVSWSELRNYPSYSPGTFYALHIVSHVVHTYTPTHATYPEPISSENEEIMDLILR